MASGAQGIKAGRAFVEVGTHDKYIAGLRSAQRRLKAFGTAVTAIGTKLIKVGALMAAPFALGAKIFGGFDKNMRMVSTMLGDAAGKWMPEFRQAAKDMAKEFGQSTGTIAKGMYDLLSAQVAPAEMLGVLRAAMKAAIGGMTDTAISVKAVVRILRGFGLEAKNATDITDVLAMIVEKGIVTFEELAETIGTVAPTAKAAGMTLDQLAATVATLLAVEEPARAMTALRTALYEAAGAGMGFMDFVRQFEGADLGKIIEAGIPKKAAQGIVILAQNLELLDKNLAAIGDRAGKAEEKYKQMAGGLAHTWGQIKASAEAAFNEVGEAIAEPLLKAGERVKEIADDIAEWVKANKELVTSILKWSVALIAVGIAMVIVGKGIAIIAGLITMLKAAAIAGKAAAVAIMFLAANPVLIALAAVVAVVGAMAYAFRKTADAAGGLSDEMRKMRIAGDKTAKQDKLRIQRLRQLAGLDKLNAKQMKEAAGEIATLTDRYGDMGASINKTTGKITGMLEAQLKLNAAIEAGFISRAKSELLEAEQQYESTRRDKRLPFATEWRGTQAEREMEEDLAREKMIAATLRLLALESGEEGDVSGGIARRMAATKAVLAKTAEIDRRIFRLKLRRIDNAAAREIEGIEERYAHERKLAEGNKALIAKLHKAEAIEKENIVREYGKREAEQVRQRKDAADAKDKARLSIEKNLQYEIERLEIMRTKKGHDQRMALIGLEERRALEAADAQGLALGLTVRKFSLMRAIAEAGKEVAKVDIGTRGTFSARALWGVGGGKAAERTAKATEATAKSVKKMLTIEQAGGLVFGR